MKTKIFGSNMVKVIFVAAAIMIAAIPGFAATSGTLNLTGSVSGVLDISVTAQPAASALDLTVNQTNLLIATVTERSNWKTGYTVTLGSANAGSGTSFFFKSADVLNTDTLAYTLNYNGSAVNLVAGSALITDASAKTTGAGVTKNLQISYNGASSFLNKDSYADTLTFTITSK